MSQTDLILATCKIPSTAAEFEIEQTKKIPSEADEKRILIVCTEIKLFYNKEQVLWYLSKAYYFYIIAQTFAVTRKAAAIF